MTAARAVLPSSAPGVPGVTGPRAGRIRPAGLPEPLAALDRTLVMGVVNVTPDSFSDGGAYLDTDAAVARGLALREAGADLVDVGGESTRPGAQRVSAADEQGRALPVVARLVAEGVAVSIDTMRAGTAAAALEAGAVLVNDVSGGLADPDMARVMAQARRPFVAMHWRGPSAGMASLATYDDVVRDVVRELTSRLDALVAAGLPVERIVVDPGIGFAKDAGHNWALLAHLDALLGIGRPLLVGSSRKGFLGSLLADDQGAPRPAAGRDDATTALTALGAAAGAWCVRVHEVAASADAVRVVAALDAARGRR